MSKKLAAVVALVASVTSVMAFTGASGADSNAGAGIADTDVVSTTTYDRPYGDYLVSTTTVRYPRLHLFGRLTAGGATFDGWADVVDLQWSFQQYLCWDPFGLPGPSCAFVTPPPTGMRADLAPGFELTGGDATGTHRIAGSCGGAGSSVSATFDVTSVHLGCSVSIDGGVSEWTWIEVALTLSGPIVTAPYAAGTYLAWHA